MEGYHRSPMDNLSQPSPRCIPCNDGNECMTFLFRPPESLLNLIATVDGGPTSSTGLGWGPRFERESANESAKSQRKVMSLRVLPIGVTGRAPVPTSIDLFLKPVEAFVVAQVPARRGDVADVEVDALGIAEVVAASESLALVEVGRLDGAEVAGFGQSVLLLLGPAFATRVAATLGQLVDRLRALDGGAGGEGCGQCDEDGGELHDGGGNRAWWKLLVCVTVCLS